MNQVLIRPEETGSQGEVRLSGRRAAHLLHVLRVQSGDSIRVGMLGGGRGRADVLGTDGETVAVRCYFDCPALCPTGITVLLALPRPKVVRRLFAPLAASGVEKVFFTNAAKVERVYFDTHWLLPEQYEPLLMEGLEQSGETRLPEIRVVRRLKPLVEDELSQWGGTRLVLHPGPGALPAVGVRMVAPVLLAIGPEGGWTDYEVDLFRAHGFTCVTLGARILRSDMAVHAMVGIVSSLLLQERENEKPAIS
ncbi:MAG: 16S rRNA (uracil(1498)-N(3))-methyltransferase [Kiritimatiellia bacterium]